MKHHLPLALLLISAGTDYADPVELNGLACLFGDKMAFMVLHPPGQSKPLSFTLSEGGSKFGVKLLSVDLANHRAQIEQSGALQSLQLCSAPHSPGSEMMRQYPAGTPGIRLLTPMEQMQLDQFVNTDEQVQKIKSGNPAITYAGLGPAHPGDNRAVAPGNPSSNASSGPGTDTGSGSSVSVSLGNSVTDAGVGQAAGQGAGTPVTPVVSADSGAGGSSAPSSSAVAPDKEYWYVTSLNIERNRLATANEVLTGAMDPLPLTPLTPAQTPPQLVGTDVYFSNHMPGYIDTSTPD